MKKGKFNIVDVFVIVGVLAVIIMAIWYVFLRDDGSNTISVSNKNEQKVVFVAKAYEVDLEAVEAIQEGDVIVALDTYQPGTVIKVERTPSKDVLALDGALVVYEDPTLYDLTVTIEAYPNIQKAYMDLGNQQIIVGNPYWIKTKDMHAQGEIISILENE